MRVAERRRGRPRRGRASSSPTPWCSTSACPELDGVEVCRRLRADGDVPILMLTARDALERASRASTRAPTTTSSSRSSATSCWRGCARCCGAGRRAAAPRWWSATCASTPTPARSSAASAQLELTAREFELLEHLMRNAGIVVSRQALLDEVWGYHPFAETNTVDVFVSNLRRKLEAGGEPRLLHTVRGAGYVLRERPVRLEDARLPVRVKVAIVTAALTFVILCLFAIVVGTVAEQRISDGFDDDLRATAADLQDKIAERASATSSGPLDGEPAGRRRRRRQMPSASSRSGEVRPPGGRTLGPPIEGVRDVGELPRGTRPIVGSDPPEARVGFRPAPGTRRSATSSTPSPSATSPPPPPTGCASSWPSACSAARRSRSSAACWWRWRAMRPIAGLTAPRARCAHARPGRHAAQAAGQRRGLRPRPHARGHAPRAGRRARRDRGALYAPARVRGRRLARAAHPAHEHPRQPRAARGGARGRAAGDGGLRAALVAPDAPAGG